MPLICPKCNTSLPENDDLEYRFCPRCGAEITTRDVKIADNFQTIPPDLHHPTAQRQARTPEPESIEIRPASIPDQTLEPEISATSKPRPQLIPPPGPPPAGFYRTDSSHPSSRAETIQDRPIHEHRKPLKLIIIVIGAITILTGGILYILLV